MRTWARAELSGRQHVVEMGSINSKLLSGLRHRTKAAATKRRAGSGHGPTIACFTAPGEPRLPPLHPQLKTRKAAV